MADQQKRGLIIKPSSHIFALKALAALLGAFAIASSGLTADAEESVNRTAPPVTIHYPSDVVRLVANQMTRWTEQGRIYIDLRGNARVFQGPAFIRGGRLLAMIRKVEQGNGQATEVQVYADPPTDFQTGPDRPETISGPTLFQMVSSQGLVVSARESAAGDASPADSLVTRGLAYFSSPPGTPLPTGVPDGFFGEMRPSAELMSMTDLSDEGVVITLRGNAEINGEDFFVAADTIRLRIAFRGGRFQEPRLQSVYAEGAAHLRREDQHIVGEAILLDVTAEEGLALDARVRARPAQQNVRVQFHADVVRQVSRYRFVCETPAFFTTSQYVPPHYRVEGKHVQLVRGPALHRWRERGEAERDAEETGAEPEEPESYIASSWHNVLYLESLPIFYWPYVAMDVTGGSYLLESLEIGDSSNLGTHVKAGWNLYDLGILYNEWSELKLLTDYYSNRGGGIGLDFVYDHPDRHGYAKLYYINDTADEDDRGIPTPRESRGQITWRHREADLPLDFTADLEIGKLSDRSYLRTYDRTEFDEAKDHETTLYLERIDANHLLTAQGIVRLNSYRTMVERQTLAYHVFGEPLGDTPLLWTSHNDLSHLQLRIDDDLPMKSPDDILRFDTLNELSLPFQTGPIRWDPYLMGSATFFSDRARNEDAYLRTAAGAGLRAATNFYRTYDVRNDCLGLDGLRHIITPTLDYMNRFSISNGPSHFVQHDEIDARDEEHVARFGVHQRFQTHRYRNGKREVVDFVVFDVDLIKEFNNPQWAGSTEDRIGANLIWEITDDITFRSVDNEYNFSTGDIERLHGGVALDFWRPLTLGLSQTYYIDTRRAARPDHNVTRFTVSYQPIYSRWRVEGVASYDFLAKRRPGDTKSPRQVEGSVTFYRQLDDWEVGLGAEFHQGRANETQIAFTLIPPGGVESERSFR